MSNSIEDQVAIADVCVIHGTSAHMAELQDGSVDLILTGPPYYSPVTEKKLDRGVSEQDNLDELDQEIQTFAWSLRATFNEAQRVLRAGGCLIVQTRDVRIRQVLSPVESIHRQLIEATGLRLYTKYLWLPNYQTLTRRRMRAALVKRYGPLSQDAEVFLVFLKSGKSKERVFDASEIELLQRALEPSPSGSVKFHHRYQAPMNVVKALIRCYSKHGDLVLDLFAGGATTLIAARDLGRRALGYEIDPDAIDLARRALSTASNSHTKKNTVA
jgi:DNA modification methylase